jgi:hypothetical protein
LGEIRRRREGICLRCSRGDACYPGRNLPFCENLHVMDAPLALGADRNLPYVFDAFDYQGFIKGDGTPDLLTSPEARQDELPLALSVVTFAAPEGD